jgi:HlyD family secretion protein
MPRSNASTIKWAVALLLLAGVAAYVIVRQTADDTPVVFKTGKVDRGTVEQIVTATGQLNAVVTVQVGSQVSGIILKLNADFNSHVTEGDVIAQIDPTRFRAALDQATAALRKAEADVARATVDRDHTKREFDRGKALVESKVIGAQELEDLRSKYETAVVGLAAAQAQVAQSRAMVGAARVDLERTTIRAPISGTVLQRAVDTGQTVAASLQAPTLFTIAQDLSKMEVRAAIDEADVGKLQEGLDARFGVDAYPGREFLATIFQIRSNPNVAQNVVTYDAILRVDNPDGKLRPGMTASVRIVSQRRENALRVPNAALRFKPAAEMVAQNSAPAAPGRTSDGGVSGRPEGAGRWADAPGGGGARAGGGGGRRAGGEGGGRPGGTRRGGEGGAGGRVFARVYKPAGEKVVAIPFRPGISDDEFTEVLGGSLTVGDDVITDAIGAGSAPAAPAARPGAGGGMRGRGPRMF